MGSLMKGVAGMASMKTAGGNPTGEVAGHAPQPGMQPMDAATPNPTAPPIIQQPEMEHGGSPIIADSAKANTGDTMKMRLQQALMGVQKGIADQQNQAQRAMQPIGQLMPLQMPSMPGAAETDAPPAYQPSLRRPGKKY